MTDFLSLISSIPSLISDFSGGTTAPYQKQQQQLAGQQQQISQAMLQGPSNPLYQSIFGQYKQQNANNLASTIAEAQGQNRMNANLGRTPLFSNERGSENIFRNVVQQQQGAGLQADQQTRAALGQAGTSSLQGLAGYNSINNSTAGANAQQLKGYQSIYDLMRGLGQPGQTQSTGSMGAGSYGPQNPNYQSQNSSFGPSGYGLNWMQQ